MGEKHNQPFQLSFNPSLRVDFQGSRVTSDGGLLLVRELDERLGLSVTGCLQKGDEPGEFAITGQDGKTWELRSSRVKLEQHVGHEVTITGSTVRSEGKTGKEESGNLRVTSVKMVSETCNK